jgi:hypothetical protein
MKNLNPFQKYFVEEFYDDYREGFLSRREFMLIWPVRRLAAFMPLSWSAMKIVV